jgi:hypothetical protein
MFSSYERLRTVIKGKAYRWYANTLELNIVGVRSASSQSNSFDDHLLLAYVDQVGRPIYREYQITTDPGKPWLLKPLDPAGCAVLIPGQYINAYMIGIHGRSRPAPRQYEALEQVVPMNYVRDNNKDATIDFSLWDNPKNVFSANLKTNIHRASKWAITKAVETYSAGCQVFDDPTSFDEFMKICRQSRDGRHLNKFTYTLLMEKDFS